MRIAVFCATRRGYRFLEKLRALLPDADLLVFSFREEPWEPPFLDNIRQLTVEYGGDFYESKQVGAARWADLWNETPIDLMFAVSWRYIIPAAVYEQARLGAYVFHDSLLPDYRGFSPTVWAIINGQNHTGVTLLENSRIQFGSGLSAETAGGVDIFAQNGMSIELRAILPWTRH